MVIFSSRSRGLRSPKLMAVSASSAVATMTKKMAASATYPMPVARPMAMARQMAPILTGRAGNGAEPHQTEGSRHRHTGADVAVDQQDHHLHHRRQDGQRHRKAPAAPLAVHTHQRRQQAQNQRCRRTNEEGRKGQARSEDEISSTEKRLLFQSMFFVTGPVFGERRGESPHLRQCFNNSCF